MAESSAVQVQHASAKSVTPVQITHRSSGLWLTERQKEIYFLRQGCHAKGGRKVCAEARIKIGFKKDLPGNPQLRIVYNKL